MRARYSAYVRQREDFLLRSWHPDTRPAEVRFDGGQDWLGLAVLDVDAGSAFESVGQVEFYARFRVSGIETALHERSTFVRLDQEWVYVDGELLTGG